MLEWKQPPEAKPFGRQRGSGKWAPIALELRQHPGQWALVSKAGHSSSLASAIKSGKMPAFAPAGAFDAVARSTGKRNEWDTYAVYVNGDAAE